LTEDLRGQRSPRCYGVRCASRSGRELRQNSGQLMAGVDVELPVDLAQVELDRVGCHEQSLGISIAEAVGGHLRDPALARGQCVAAAVRRPPRTDPLAASSVRARSARAAAPQSSARSSPARRGSRAGERRFSRRMAPRRRRRGCAPASLRGAPYLSASGPLFNRRKWHSFDRLSSFASPLGVSGSRGRRPRKRSPEGVPECATRLTAMPPSTNECARRLPRNAHVW
jgi:hypothetical protein